MKPSRRRTSEVVGYVNFPMHRIACTGEGGCFVRLVVLDAEDYADKWVPCCGGYQYFHYDECFLGDDLYEELPMPPEDENPKKMMQYFRDLDKARKKRDAKYYPRLDNDEDSGRWSVRVLAAMTIGATGWSSGEWRCTYEDLTDEGKALYDSLQRLYAGRQVRLLTYLDT